MKILDGVALLSIILQLPCAICVQSDIKSVRYGTNLLQKQSKNRESASDIENQLLGIKQGRLLHQGSKISIAATGTCETMNWKDKVAIAARWDEDVSWMAMYMPIPYVIYSTSGDVEATHRTVSNTGREAQAYIQFIVDYYDCLPQYMAFIHAHRSSRHSPDILMDLKRLKWEENPGYVSLSRPVGYSLFYLGNPEKNKPDEEAYAADAEVAKWSQFAYEQNVNILAHWQTLFQEEFGEVPASLRSPNGGQFAVKKENILAHPKEFWQKQLHWMRRTSMDPFWAGLVYEHMWSFVMGAGANYTHPEECEMFLCEPPEMDFRESQKTSALIEQFESSGEQDTETEEASSHGEKHTKERRSINEKDPGV